LAGDETAVAICREAGAELALQMSALLNRHPVCDVTVAGSVWKGNPHMFETFRDEISKTHPGIQITLPSVEPVMGGVFHEAIRRGITLDDSLIRRRFAAYILRDAIDCVH